MKLSLLHSVMKLFIVTIMLVAGVPGLVHAQDGHIDPASDFTMQRLSFSRHTEAGFTTGQIDGLLAFGSQKLQECDNRSAADQDVACQVGFERSGGLGIFGTAGDGLDIVDNAAEVATVQSQPGFVKLVTAILLNGKIITGIADGIPSSSLILAVEAGGTRTTAEYGQTFVHEFGHTRGLMHRGLAGAPPLVGSPFMDPSAGEFYEVNLAECAAYHIGGVAVHPNRPVDILFLIDDTGSMTEEIGGVKAAITLGLSATSIFLSNSCKWVFQLVTFKDNYTPRAPTTDLNEVKNQVSALFASGGDDCPEGSAEALDAAKEKVRDGGIVFIATDASPHPGTNLEAIKNGLTAREIKVFTILSGDCAAGTFSTLAAGSGVDPAGSIPYSDNRDTKSRGSVSTLALSPNPGAIEAFSYLSQQTGGVFAFVPEVNSGLANDETRFQNIAYNMLIGGVAPAITTLEPGKAPAGGIIALTING